MIYDKQKFHAYVIIIIVLAVSITLVTKLSSSGTNKLTGIAIFDEEQVTKSLIEAERTQTKEEITKPMEERAGDAIADVRVIIGKVKAIGFGTTYFEDKLFEMEESYAGVSYEEAIDELREMGRRFERKRAMQGIENAKKQGATKFGYNYSRVVELGYELKQREETAYEIFDGLSLFKKRIAEYELEGVPVDVSRNIMNEAEQAFNEERYESALDLLTRGNENLEKAKEEQTGVNFVREASKNFLQRNWLQILIIFVIIIVATPFIAKITYKKRMQNKLAMLKIKEQSTLTLMKRTQERRFVKKEISENTYNVLIDRYKERLTNIRKDIKFLESVMKKGEYRKVKKKRGILEIK